MTKHTILFLAANPVGTDRRALDEEARAIHEELERSGHRDEFELVTRWAARPLDLLRELRKLKPTIVHFSGHGGHGESGNRSRDVSRRDLVVEPVSSGGASQRGLFFEGPDGQPHLVSTATLEETFGAAGSSVRLVVLDTCYSEAQTEALLPYVGCVVGMGGSIRDDSARNFAIGFYGGLGERESIAAAFRQGRAAISLDGLTDNEKPQLKVRSGIAAEQLILATGCRANETTASATETRITNPRVATHGQIVIIENNYGRIIIGDSYPRLITRAAIIGLVAGVVLFLGWYAAPVGVAWFGIVIAWLFKKRKPQEVHASGGGVVARSIVGAGIAATVAVSPELLQAMLAELTIPNRVIERSSTLGPVQRNVIDSPNLASYASRAARLKELLVDAGSQDGHESNVGETPDPELAPSGGSRSASPRIAPDPPVRPPPAGGWNHAPEPPPPRSDPTPPMPPTPGGAGDNDSPGHIQATYKPKDPMPPTSDGARDNDLPARIQAMYQQRDYVSVLRACRAAASRSDIALHCFRAACRLKNSDEASRWLPYTPAERYRQLHDECKQCCAIDVRTPALCEKNPQACR